VEFKPNGPSRNFNAKVVAAMKTVAEHLLKTSVNSSSGVLRRIGHESTNTLSGAKSTNPPQAEQVRSNQSTSGQILA
jgi:hypothetical protein